MRDEADKNAKRAAHRFLAGLTAWLLIGCAPPVAVDRTTAPAAPETPVMPADTDASLEPAPSPVPLPTADAGTDDTLAPMSPPPAPSPSDPLPAPTADAGGPAPDATAGAPQAPPSQPPSADAQPVVDVAPPPAHAALVVGNVTPPSAGDLQMRRLLEARGYVVSMLLDTQPPRNAASAQVIIISSSCRGSVLMGAYRDVLTPIVTMKISVFDDMDFTGSNRSIDFDESDGSNLLIFDEGHPLAAGLRGTIRATSVPSSMAWGRPAAGAHRIAGLAETPARVTIFAFDKGAPMMTRRAPAKRVGLFVTDGVAEKLTPEGQRLFAAAVDWAAH
jgi:hypothetical protein